jgi:hypothetical protein
MAGKKLINVAFSEGCFLNVVFRMVGPQTPAPKTRQRACPKIYYEQRTRLYPFPERVGITSKKNTPGAPVLQC